MAILTSLTLSSLTPETLFMTVVDESNGNAVIPGTYSGLAFSSSDTTQDTAVANATVAQGVDIDAVTQTGGTSIVAACSFSSTKLKADGTPLVSGTFSATLNVVNNVLVKAALVFNQ